MQTLSKEDSEQALGLSCNQETDGTHSPASLAQGQILAVIYDGVFMSHLAFISLNSGDGTQGFAHTRQVLSKWLQPFLYILF